MLQTQAISRETVTGAYEGTTYYDLPALKSGHYGWLISAYFFVGGLASAAEFLATVVDFFGSREDRVITRAGRYIALLGALVSPPLLILDLKTPGRWYNMLRIFRKTSSMSIGSWALSLFGVFSGLAAVGQAVEDVSGWSIGRWAARIAGLPAALAGGVVAIYTGTLLAATNIPFWASGFPFLSSLFASSAASTATAALILATPRASARTHRRLETFALIAGLSELFFAARINLHWQKRRAATPLHTPAVSAGWRFGVLGLGILIPLALHVIQLAGWRRSGAVSTAAAVSALTGGFLLRGVFVFGGKESGRRPRDYFRMTR